MCVELLGTIAAALVGDGDAATSDASWLAEAAKSTGGRHLRRVTAIGERGAVGPFQTVCKR